MEDITNITKSTVKESSAESDKNIYPSLLTNMSLSILNSTTNKSIGGDYINIINSNKEDGKNLSSQQQIINKETIISNDTKTNIKANIIKIPFIFKDDINDLRKEAFLLMLEYVNLLINKLINKEHCDGFLYLLLDNFKSFDHTEMKLYLNSFVRNLYLNSSHRVVNLSQAYHNLREISTVKNKEIAVFLNRKLRDFHSIFIVSQYFKTRVLDYFTDDEDIKTFIYVSESLLEYIDS